MPPPPGAPAPPMPLQRPGIVETLEYASPNLQPTQPNHLAFLSVVCGSFGFFLPFIPSIIGIVTGILGLRSAREKRATGGTVCIVGICLSISSLLLGGLFGPMMYQWYGGGHPRKNQDIRACAGRMKSIGQAMMLYANDNGGAFPPTMGPLIITQDITAEAFICPATLDQQAVGPDTLTIAQGLDAGGRSSYLYFGTGLNDRTSGANTVLLAEPLSNHRDGINLLFGDGSTQFIMGPQARSMIAQLQAGTNPPK